MNLIFKYYTYVPLMVKGALISIPSNISLICTHMLSKAIAINRLNHTFHIERFSKSNLEKK